MPVVTITGPSGLTKDAKKQPIEGTLHVLTETYQMPDDRVYIHEVPAEHVGHTPLLKVTHGESWAVQSEPARIFVEVTAPPGLPIETKRKLMRGSRRSLGARTAARTSATCSFHSTSTRLRTLRPTGSFRPKTRTWHPSRQLCN